MQDRLTPENVLQTCNTLQDTIQNCIGLER